MLTDRSLKACLLGILLLVVSGCGGGGGNGDADAVQITNPPPLPPPAEPASISAVVEGTTVIAVDQTGSIVALDDTAGRTPDRDTDGDGQPDGYSITLADLPVNTPIRVFLISSGSIAALVFDTDAVTEGKGNAFSITSGGVLELGLVTIESEGDIPTAIAEFNPTQNSSVAGTSFVAGIPLGINEPPTTGLTLNQLNERSLKALRDGWLGGAKTYSSAAVTLAGTSATNAADLARITSALARIAAVAGDAASDGDHQDLERLGDLLDAFGVPDDFARGSPLSIVVPDAQGLPTDSPSGNAVRDFLYETLGGELQEALALLDAVSEVFQFNLSNAGSDSREVDYGDVLVVRSIVASALASIATATAHDLNLDVDQTLNTRPTAEQLLADRPYLLSIGDPTRLTLARSAWIEAIDALDAAAVWMSEETDDQSDDLLTLDDEVISSDLVAAREYLAALRASITDGTTDIDASLTLNLQTFFEGEVDFRTDGLLPAIVDNRPAAEVPCFPDATFGGVVLSPDLGADGNGDGLCDLLD